MAALTTDKFLDLLRRSGLVESDLLEKALQELERQGISLSGDESAKIADRLIDRKLITSWQRDKLMDGRNKGFFLGKYKLLGLLGTGGMSSVYLAEHTKMHHRVALKVLPKSRVNDSSYLARFMLEAQSAARLVHNNIVRAYDIDNEDNIHYLVMEYVEGRDLQSMVHDDGPMDYDTAADYIRQAAEGLEHAHQAGLIHRDVKPANLLVDQKGVVKVLDLGLARWEQNEQNASLTIAHEENVLGTADYLAPEQAKNSHSADKRADIYSLGCTLYFLLTGHAPFPEGTLGERILKHVNQMPKSVYEDRPDAPPQLVDVCVRMMAKEPAARYQSGAEVAQVLAKWLEQRAKGMGTSGPHRIVRLPPRRPSTTPAKPPRRGDKSGDDTVSNLNKETLAGDPGKSYPGLAEDQPSRPESSIVGRGGSSVMGRSGASSVSHSGSNIMGGSRPGGSSKKSQPLPVAKSLEPQPDAQPAGEAKKDETLSAMIDDALREIESHSVIGKDKVPGLNPATSSAYRFKHQQGLPKWFWFALLGGVAALAGIVGLVLALVKW